MIALNTLGGLPTLEAPISPPERSAPPEVERKGGAAATPRDEKPALGLKTADAEDARPTLARPQLAATGLMQGWGPRLR